MLFIRQENLKVGMRLAKPIYNKKGVLLYERDSKLTSQGIESVKNFGIIGLYILEPAEPVPPMTDDDVEFELARLADQYNMKLEDVKKAIANQVDQFKNEILNRRIEDFLVNNND